MAEKDPAIKNAIVTIKIIGVGGGGNSVLLRMAKNKVLDIDLIAVNTDAKQLAIMQQAGVIPLQIGESLTKGRGTGGSLELGEMFAPGGVVPLGLVEPVDYEMGKRVDNGR